MSSVPEILFSVVLDGAGGLAEPSSDGFRWTHLDRTGDHILEWLINEIGLDTVVAEALIAEDTRPRSVRIGDGLMLIMRGFNFNPGADIDDLISLRIWIDEERAVTLRRRKLLSANDVRESLEAGRGPTGPGEFLVAIADALVSRMAQGIRELEEAADSVEETVLSSDASDLRSRLAELRRQLITVRRHLAPQRDALTRLFGEDLSWLSSADRVALRETVNQTTRYVEELDTARERAAITQEELNTRISEQLNHRMYALSVVAGIFLPLGLLTGLLGINVGGIPGAEYKGGFAIFCGLLGVIAALQFLLYRRLRWL